MRCKCGVIINHGQKRCKRCAVDYIRQVKTDRFETFIQEEPIVLSQEEVKLWQEMTPRKLPKVKASSRQSAPWDETLWQRQQRRRLYAGVALALVVLALAAVALVYG